MTQTAPAAPAPTPTPPPRSTRGLLIALLAVGVALLIVATVAITLLVTRTDNGQAAPATTAAATASPTDPVGDTPADLKLRGPATSPFTACSMAGPVGKAKPAFTMPVAYDSTTESRAKAGRDALVRLATQISPDVPAPVGPAVQRWITVFGAFYQGVQDHASTATLTAINSESLAANESANLACASVGVR